MGAGTPNKLGGTFISCEKYPFSIFLFTSLQVKKYFLHGNIAVEFAPLFAPKKQKAMTQKKSIKSQLKTQKTRKESANERNQALITSIMGENESVSFLAFTANFQELYLKDCLTNEGEPFTKLLLRETAETPIDEVISVGLSKQVKNLSQEEFEKQAKAGLFSVFVTDTGNLSVGYLIPPTWKRLNI